MVIACKYKVKENIITEIMPLNYVEFEDVFINRFKYWSNNMLSIIFAI